MLNNMSKVEVQAAPPDGAEVRDWAKLHRDALTVIFHKVGMHEVLLRTSKVCSRWRKAARDEPLLWRKIDMGMNYSDGCPMYEEFERLGAMITFDKARANLTKVAVNWGGNSVQELRIRGCCVYYIIDYIAERARNLKILSVIECYKFIGVIAHALGRLKQLEELEFEMCTAPPELLETIGTECPKLKRLKLKYVDLSCTYDVQEGLSTWLEISETMLQLEYLQLKCTWSVNSSTPPHPLPKNKY